MKLALTSDLHGNLPDLKIKADVLIIAGDIGPDHDNIMSAAWFNTRFYNWCQIVKQNIGDIVVIAGNHDFVFEEAKGLISEDLLKTVHYLDVSGVEINGTKFFGSAWTPYFYKWAFNAPENPKDAEKFFTNLYDSFPKDIDVLVTHGPLMDVLIQILKGKVLDANICLILLRRFSQNYMFAGIYILDTDRPW